MGEKTGIAWTDHTFNPWWGCTKISPACTNCYAAAVDERFSDVEHWGDKAPRRFFADKHWNEPVKWNRAAETDGVRRRVFCASMADVFEDRRDLDEHRARLWRLIAATDSLDWLLLTKRPENINGLMPPYRDPMFGEPAWPNVWLGTTVENQMYARERIPVLLAAPARVHFLSCEPLLGELDLRQWLGGAACLDAFDGTDRLTIDPSLDWVIAGCESGRGARETDIEWYRSLRDQCDGSAAFFLKQATEDQERCKDCGRLVRYTVLGHDDAQASCGCTHEGPEFCGFSGIGAGEGSKRKGGGLIELPYLDGKQHADFPR